MLFDTRETVNSYFRTRYYSVSDQIIENWIHFACIFVIIAFEQQQKPAELVFVYEIYVRRITGEFDN